jgi:hypothetical protein
MMRLAFDLHRLFGLLGVVPLLVLPFTGFLLLYVSGLLRWLCLSGKVHDRGVNLAVLRPFLYRVKELG